MRFDITEDAVLYMHPELVLFILFVKPGGGPGYIVCSPQVVTCSVEMPLWDAQFMFLWANMNHKAKKYEKRQKICYVLQQNRFEILYLYPKVFKYYILQLPQN